MMMKEKSPLLEEWTFFYLHAAKDFRQPLRENLIHYQRGNPLNRRGTHQGVNKFGTDESELGIEKRGSDLGLGGPKERERNTDEKKG